MKEGVGREEREKGFLRKLTGFQDEFIRAEKKKDLTGSRGQDTSLRTAVYRTPQKIWGKNLKKGLERFV
jgi:hypothetical protein